MFGEVGIARCGRARGIANLLCEGFGGFKLGSSGTWAEGQDACCTQRIGDARREGGFWADDHEVYGLFLGESDNGCAIIDVERYACRQLGYSGITRGDEEFVTLRVLRRRPREGMFTASASKNKDVHLRNSCLAFTCSRSKLARKEIQARRNVRSD